MLVFQSDLFGFIGALHSCNVYLQVIPGGFHELHFEPDGVGTGCINDIVSWISERTQ